MDPAVPFFLAAGVALLSALLGRKILERAERASDTLLGRMKNSSSAAFGRVDATEHHFHAISFWVSDASSIYGSVVGFLSAASLVALEYESAPPVGVWSVFVVALLLLVALLGAVLLSEPQEYGKPGTEGCRKELVPTILIVGNLAFGGGMLAWA